MTEPPVPPAVQPPAAPRRPALRVATGILLTRLLGLVRVRVFAFYFGDGMEADAFQAALKIPNAIRNLLGEGTLSASFIPVYAALIERGETNAARTMAGTLASLIVVAASASALVGFLLAPIITDLVAPGFAGPTRDLTVTLVEILFPMSGVMIVSAWCLGVLNTHRRFFLSYAAPTLWNIAQITTLVALGGMLAGVDLVTALAWGALAGSILQVAVQLPTTLRCTGRIRWSLSLRDMHVRQVIKKWLPVVFGAGVMQIASFIDTVLGSLVGEGAVATLAYAQLVAILPVSLFGVSVAAAALPELSREASRLDRGALRTRLAAGAQRMAFFVIPSAATFVVLGTHVIAPLYQTGAFGADQTLTVAAVLAVYGFAIPAQALVRLLTSGHYALGDTRTPVWIAGLSVTVSAAAAFLLMRLYGVVGIAMGSMLGAYVNASLNYHTLAGRTQGIVGKPELGATAIALLAAVVAAAAAWGLDRVTALDGIWMPALLNLGTFGLVYLSLAKLLGHPQISARRDS